MQSHYDKDRHLNLVKLADNGGNLYIFNVPPDVVMTPGAILLKGELISVKEGSKPFKRPDGRSDLFHRNYQKLPPLHLTGSQFETELLTASKKNAPVVGSETKYPFPAAPAAPAAPPIKKETTEMFEGQTVLRDERGSAYIPVTRQCVDCHADIPGKFHVSEVNGKFTRKQGFSSSTKAGPAAPGSKGWKCEKCLGSKKARKAPAKKVVEVERKTPAEGSVVVVGANGFKFEQHDGSFWFQGQQIVKEITQLSPEGIHAVYRESPCFKCGEPIKFRSAVSYRDGKPWNVAGKVPCGQNAVIAAPKSPNWVCEACATGKPAPAAGSASESSESSSKALEPAPNSAKSLESGSTPDPTSESALDAIAAISQLENMAVDPTVDDKTFRGAAWMLSRVLGRIDK